jgi:hypothetical protein
MDKSSETHTKRGEKLSCTEKLPFEFLTFLSENTWQPKNIGACWIQKSPSFLFLEDVHEKKLFLGP